MSNPTRQGARPPGPRHLRLEVEFLDDGGLRLSSPEARGYAVTVRGPLQLWTRLNEDVRIEAAVAGYSRSRGVIYDLDALTDPTDPTEPKRRRPYTPREVVGDCSEVSYSRGAVVRPDQVHPSEYTPNPDGTWTSRTGRRISHPAKVRGIVITRHRMGLSTTYEQWSSESGEAS